LFLSLAGGSATIIGSTYYSTWPSSLQRIATRACVSTSARSRSGVENLAAHGKKSLDNIRTIASSALFVAGFCRNSIAGATVRAFAMPSDEEEPVKTSVNEECRRILNEAMENDEDIKAVKRMGGVFNEIPIEYKNPRSSPGAAPTLYGRAVWTDTAADGRLFAPQEKRPVVFVVHAAVGQQEDFISWRLRSLAALGYVAFAVDMFGSDRAIWDSHKCKDIRMPLYEDRSMVIDRFLAGVNAAATRVPVADVSRCAIIGFCFGGMVVLDVARSLKLHDDLQLAISFHGILDGPKLYDPEKRPPTEIGHITRPKVMIYHGKADPFIPRENYDAFVTQMNGLGIDYTLREFDGVGHAFTRPEKITPSDIRGGFGYDARVAEETWEETKSLLQKYLLGLR